MPEQFILDGDCMLRVDHGEFVLAEDAEDLVAEVNRLRADRRERIATACLSAFRSVPDWDPGPTEAAKAAIRYANALIAELDEREAKP